jgi:hypothetical protein
MGITEKSLLDEELSRRNAIESGTKITSDTELTDINNEYENVIIPLERKLFDEKIPRKLYDLFSDFSQKIESVLKVKFEECPRVEWPIETRYMEFGTPSFEQHRRKDLVEAFKKEKLDPKNVSVEIRWQYGDRKYPYRDQQYYFGISYNPDGTIKYFLANRYERNYTGQDNELQPLVEKLADVLSSKSLFDLGYVSEVEYDSTDNGTGWS